MWILVCFTSDKVVMGYVLYVNLVSTPLLREKGHEYRTSQNNGWFTFVLWCGDSLSFHPGYFAPIFASLSALQM